MKFFINYMGCGITYYRDLDIQNKLKKFYQICGTTVKNKTQLKFYKVMAVTILMYRSKT